MRLVRQPFLTREEERTASAEALVLSHSRLVMKMAHRFARYGVDAEDLAQEGQLGLMHAARKFDPEKGYRFSTYAAFWVRERMMEAVFRGCSVVRPSTGPKARSVFFRSGRHFDMSIDAPVSEGGTSFADTMVCPAPLPDALAEEAIDGGLRTAGLREALADLPPRDVEIVTSRFLCEPKQSLDEIGSRLGLSKERVRQIEARALEKLRKTLRPDHAT